MVFTRQERILAVNSYIIIRNMCTDITLVHCNIYRSAVRVIYVACQKMQQKVSLTWFIMYT